MCLFVGRDFLRLRWFRSFLYDVISGDIPNIDSSPKSQSDRNPYFHYVFFLLHRSDLVRVEWNRGGFQRYGNLQSPDRPCVFSPSSREIFDTFRSGSVRHILISRKNFQSTNQTSNHACLSCSYPLLSCRRCERLHRWRTRHRLSSCKCLFRWVRVSSRPRIQNHLWGNWPNAINADKSFLRPMTSQY